MQQQQQQGAHRRLQGARGARGALRNLLKHSGEVRAAPATVPIPNAWCPLKKAPVDTPSLTPVKDVLSVVPKHPSRVRSSPETGPETLIALLLLLNLLE